MKKYLFLLLIVVIFLSGCSGTLDLEINFPGLRSYQGLVVNETDYTLNILIEDLSNKNVRYSFNLSPGRVIEIVLAEKLYRFSAVRAYSGENPISGTVHINGVKGDSEFEQEAYDWLAIFSGRRIYFEP